MTQVFAILKVVSFIQLLAMLATSIAAAFGVWWSIYPIFGSSMSTSIMVLAVSLTRLGKLYFTFWFRLMVFLMLMVQTVECTDILFEYLSSAQYANLTSSLIITAVVSGVLGMSLPRKKIKTDD